MLGAEFGNVLVGIQPAFGYEGDPMRLLFDGQEQDQPARDERGDRQADAAVHGEADDRKANLVGARLAVGGEATNGGSTDAGDLSQIMPVLHPMMTGAAGAHHQIDWHIQDHDAVVATSKLGERAKWALMVMRFESGPGQTALDEFSGVGIVIDDQNWRAE